jgi:hypothetical protein
MSTEYDLLTAWRAVDEGFEDSGALQLLAARELRSGLIYLLHLFGWTRATLFRSVEPTNTEQLSTSLEPLLVLFSCRS